MREPRPLSETPSFPELVAYFLPEKEWLYLVPPDETPAKTTRPKPGSRPLRLNDYHYDLLNHSLKCDKAKLEAAYKDWRKLADYENGESVATSLLIKIAPFALAWNIFNDIMVVFTGKDEALRACAREKWIKKGVTEAVRDSKWTMFQIVEKGIIDVALLGTFTTTQDINPFVNKSFWRNKELLGKKLRSSKA